MHNPMFITPDVSIQLHSILALSRSGSSLNVHLHNGSKIPFLPTGEWELEQYTEQWKALIAEDLEAQLEDRARMEARHPAPGMLQAINGTACPSEAAWTPLTDVTFSKEAPLHAGEKGPKEPVTAKTANIKTSAKTKPKTNNKD